MVARLAGVGLLETTAKALLTAFNIKMVKKQSKGAPKQEKKGKQETVNYIYYKEPRKYHIGGDIQPKRDLYRFVKWPENIQIQRKKRILYKRLKVPPAIAQFQRPLDKNQTTNLFKFLSKYRPESKEEKQNRLQ